MLNNFTTTIKKPASSSFVEFTYAYPWEEKIVYLALITNIPKVIVEELQKIQKNSYGKTYILK